MKFWEKVVKKRRTTGVKVVQNALTLERMERMEGIPIQKNVDGWPDLCYSKQAR